MLPGCDFPVDRTVHKAGNQQHPRLKTEHRKIQDEVTDLKIGRKCKRHPVGHKKNRFGAVGIKEKRPARTAKKTEVALRSKMSQRWMRKTIVLTSARKLKTGQRPCGAKQVLSGNRKRGTLLREGRSRPARDLTDAHRKPAPGW
jgi:hypothetical protein